MKWHNRYFSLVLVFILASVFSHFGEETSRNDGVYANVSIT
jgi:hypothetical protein